MPSRLQTAFAILLLALTTVFGQAGVWQCLCTGEIAIGSAASCGCLDDGTCSDSGDREQNPPAPDPCHDGSCWTLLDLGAADKPASLAPTPPHTDAAPPAGFSTFDLVRPPLPGHALGVRSRPPDPPAVPLTVLFSSFLI